MSALTNKKAAAVLASLLILSTTLAAVALLYVAVERSSDWRAVAAELLLVFVLGLEGIIAYGAFFREENVSDQERRQRTIDFYRRFYEPYWRQVAQVTWRIRDRWLNEDRSMLDFFFIAGPTPHEPPEANGLTANQNLSVLLHYWAELEVCLRAGLLDDHLVLELLTPQLAWYEKFFSEFVEAYHERRVADKIDYDHPSPLWVASIPSLLRELHRIRTSVARPKAKPSALATSSGGIK